MSDTAERRAKGVKRISVTRIVDICGRDPSIPAFEAESVEVSGRGMHVRTPYLPPLGAPLVCRFEHDGREIVVEGAVAWHADRDGGGELGIQFTALDAGSVETLRGLCGLDEAEAAREAPRERAEAAAPAPAVEPPGSAAGDPVKLHISGLAAPMKARVRDPGSRRRLQVGSNLEFLKVGRGLEVEDLERGGRRGARIDSVAVAIDPETQVPQLVVSLRFEGVDATPEPQVVSEEDSPVAAPVVRTLEAEIQSASQPSAPAHTTGDGAPLEESAVPPAFRGRLDGAAVEIGHAAEKAGKRLAEASGVAGRRLAALAVAGGRRVAEIAARRGASAAAMRTTSPAPSLPPTQNARRLRPQSGEVPVIPEVDPRLRRRLVVGAGALVLVTAVALAFGGGKSTDAQVAAAAAPAEATAPAEPGAVAPLAAAAPPAPAPAQPGAPAATVVANVPLFGPTPMTALEPAPLGPPPGAASPPEERMDLGPAPAPEGPSASAEEDEEPEEKATPSAPRPEDVKPLVQGKLHLPVVHRLALDEPGAALEGKPLASGFTVFVPRRKIEGSGTAIVKRDDRLADVKIKNAPEGARVTFTFRGKVPSYKVRLKGKAVEFFVSTPGGK